eukprot:1140281-Pelagomonas_calceolata.AAC.1
MDSWQCLLASNVPKKRALRAKPKHFLRFTHSQAPPNPGGNLQDTLNESTDAQCMDCMHSPTSNINTHACYDVLKSSPSQLVIPTTQDFGATGT